MLGFGAPGLGALGFDTRAIRHATRPTPTGWAHANATGYLPGAYAREAARARRSQLAATKDSLRYRLTACSGTRNDRPTRIASSSPEWTRR